MQNESTSSFNGTTIRFIVKSNHILFAAHDIAKALKFSNPRRAVINTLINDVTYITGTFNWNNGDLIFMADETFIIDLIANAEKEIARTFISWLVLNMAKYKHEETNLQNDANVSVSSNVSTFSTTQIAKRYGLSAKKLNEVLHLERVHYKTNNQWVLYSKYSRLGLTKTFMIAAGNDNKKKVYHSYWTKEGVKFIENILSSIGTTKNSQGTLF